MKTEIYAAERKGPSMKSPSTSDESIVSTIGSSTTYTAVLENPRLIFNDRARKTLDGT